MFTFSLCIDLKLDRLCQQTLPQLCVLPHIWSAGTTMMRFCCGLQTAIAAAVSLEVPATVGAAAADQAEGDAAPASQTVSLGQTSDLEAACSSAPDASVSGTALLTSLCCRCRCLADRCSTSMACICNRMRNRVCMQVMTLGNMASHIKATRSGCLNSISLLHRSHINCQCISLLLLNRAVIII